MPSHKQRQMQSDAIQRVLARSMDRASIGSLADPRRLYQAELAADYAEIEARADEVRARFQKTNARILGNILRCAVCDEPLRDAKRMSRRYCSGRAGNGRAGLRGG